MNLEESIIRLEGVQAACDYIIKKNKARIKVLNRRIKIADIVSLICFIFVFLFFCANVFAQESTSLSHPEDVKVYTYDGWQDKTTLRSNWNAAEGEPPKENDRLYIYKDGVKQGPYYERVQDKWVPKNDEPYEER